MGMWIITQELRMALLPQLKSLKSAQTEKIIIQVLTAPTMTKDGIVFQGEDLAFIISKLKIRE